MEIGSHDKGSQRLDKWLWFARFFKSRSEAANMCTSRHLRLDGRVIEKPHATVRVGSVISFPRNGCVVVVKVEGIPERRGPFILARTLYKDLSPPAFRPATSGPSGNFLPADDGLCAYPG